MHKHVPSINYCDGHGKIIQYTCTVVAMLLKVNYLPTNIFLGTI